MPKRLLLVDDMEAMLTTNARALGYALGSEWEIIGTSSPIDAITRINTGQPFEVVVSDFQMPGMFGDQVIMAARRRKGADTLCIILTGTLTEAQNACRKLPEEFRPHHLVQKGLADSTPDILAFIRTRFPAPDPPATT